MSQSVNSNAPVLQPIQNQPEQNGRVNRQGAPAPDGLGNAHAGGQHPPRVQGHGRQAHRPLRATRQQNAGTVTHVFAQATGLVETRVMHEFYGSPEILGLLRSKYFALPQNERPPLGSEAFAAFCQNIMQGVIDAKGEAILGIAEMAKEQMGDAERNRPINQVLTSSVNPLMFTTGLEIASVIADTLDAGRLRPRLRPGT